MSAYPDSEPEGLTRDEFAPEDELVRRLVHKWEDEATLGFGVSPRATIVALVKMRCAEELREALAGGPTRESA